jgi:hypothetical protein
VLIPLSSCPRGIHDGVILELNYVRLAPGFVREVLEIYESWEGKDTVPMKIRELMMVIEIEVNKLYDPGASDRVTAMPKPPTLKDTKLG